MLEHKRATWSHPIFLPEPLFNYLEYLDGTDIKLLFLMYRENSLSRNRGVKIFVRPAQLISQIGCDMSKLERSFKKLEKLKLVFVLHKASLDWVIRLVPPLQKRWITYEKNNLPVAYLTTSEKKALKKEGKLV